MAALVIGVLPAGERARLDAAFTNLGRTVDLGESLGQGWRELAGTAGLTFVHRATLAIVEATATGDRLDAPPALVLGDDARHYLTDLLRRYSSAAEVADLLFDLQGAPPLVLEAFRGGQRLVLPRLPCVIELRGRKGLDAVRIEDDRASAAAIDAALRALPDLAALRLLCGDDLRPVNFAPPHTHWLALGGHLGIAALDAGGFRMLSPDEARDVLLGRVAAAPDVAGIDRLMAAWFDAYERRETAVASGKPDVRWRVPSIGLELGA